ncbi:MAG: hypothetical protein RQ741_13915 [Wenzhouxiangellaceae bacterium]|nr:hypothetical protein [Wenzhouxiangellaceae bacterium]
MKTTTVTVSRTATIGGSVTGLASGNQVVLLNNGGDDLVLSANGSFTFATELTDTSAYVVTVLTNPTAPNQTCSVTNAAGTLAGADVTNVEVTCVNNQFSVGGTVAGLQGDQVVLQNNGNDDQVFIGDGGFTFSAQQDGSSYSITVASQPNSPTQLCSVTSGAGTLSGLQLPGLVLELDNGSLLLFDQDGTYTFSTGVADGTDYSVTAPLLPDEHDCSIANATGSIAGTDVVDVDVACTTDIEFADGFETLSETPLDLN